MQTKELLSQKEIDALLDVFNSSDEEKSTDILFEIRMAKIAKGIENHLDSLGLQFDNVRVVKSTSVHKNSYNYIPEYPYLQNLSMDNSLALTILATRFGSKEKSFSLDRPLTSLENRLLKKLCKEIEYMVEKELDDYFLKDNMLEEIADHSVVITQENSQSMMQFSFTTQTIVSSTHRMLQEKETVETDDVEGTKIEAVIGTITTKTLEQGATYKMLSFPKNSALLSMDASMIFMAKTLQKSDDKLLFELQNAVYDSEFSSSHALGCWPLIDKTMLAGYCLSVARTIIDDGALLTLDYGTVLALKPYDDVQIHKDGKMVAKAKLFFSDSEIAVKVL
ncbi:MAG: hypothetical protein WBG65_02660 [Sulfurimonadaceae bacterium]